MESQLTLSLPEALLLLAIDDRSGVVRGGGELRYGLAGAMLIELSQQGRLLSDTRSLAALDRSRTGDVLLDEVLGLMRHVATPRPARSWLLRITRAIHDLQPSYLERLMRAGIVRHEQARAFSLFSTDSYPLLTQGVRYGLAEQLRQLVLADAPARPRDAALLRLVDACGLLSTLFSGGEGRMAHTWLVRRSSTDRMSQVIADSVASLRQDSAEFAYIVGIG